MIVCGCDIGSLTAKAVLINENQEVIAAEFMRGSAIPEQSAKEIIAKAVAAAGVSNDDIQIIVGTGYGREQIPFVDDIKSEIACHGKSAKWHIPTIKSVIDIGGQDAKAIRVDENGDISRYMYNDQCASGTGRFLEVISEALEVKLEDMGDLALQSTNPVTISSQCVVFAETEVVSLINAGVDKKDIAAGLHQALASRVASLAKGIEIEPDITMTGGGAKNIGLFKALEKELNITMVRMDDKIDPQVNGAFGAALFALELTQIKKAS